MNVHVSLVLFGVRIPLPALHLRFGDRPAR